ncbi:hypothetical protein FRAHR75_1380017 [Frankia sp. Hr75.2]|nr:hypothetical protein FRAHR75_1380017 [Frankia sp. Hr75.2]
MILRCPERLRGWSPRHTRTSDRDSTTFATGLDGIAASRRFDPQAALTTVSNKTAEEHEGT